jgi:ribosome-binding factor A
MAGHRSERAGERIHQEISILLDREISDPRLANVNLTRVDVTSDLRLAKIYVAPSQDKAEEKEMMAALARASGFFRRHIAKSLNLHFAPEIRFYADRSIEAGERFLQALERVHEEERAAAPPKPKRARRTKTE